MPHFNLSLGDYAALAALMLTAAGGQFAVSSAQIETAEARIVGEFQLKAQESQNALNNLSGKFDGMSVDVSRIVKEGLSARSSEVMASLSSLVGFDESFTIKVANIPRESLLYDHFVTLTSLEGNSASLYTVDSTAIGSVRVSSFSDANASSIKTLLEDAEGQNYDDVKVLFQFDTETTTIIKEDLIQTLNFRIETLQRQVDDYAQK